MHEFGIAESILAAVEGRADGRRIRRARVQVGALLRVAEPSLNDAFSLVAEGTVAEGARLDLVTVPVRLTCRACAGTATSVDPYAVCPHCGDTDVDVEGGDDLVLESIQLAEAAHVPGNSRGDRGDPQGSS
ncbi:putative hydrogenase nickel incorporation protein HypA 2 [Sphaerisporangium krabiense]|uniref:Hydrogenase maturation factor HypA n=1 Tax=Sphaerisporangium krabiense TaxID=763782 RepID=A0A7W9DR30_9ACTN|nr:hydrogenase maturation nickel metallochaperone HypA [Sphaerisporangium krabiense]MBB5628207.1 hydrogenase nickel incorporation protein HypA/HybF [Sphaerisporangium krabiense]GII66202.1 putative hydrogenase nickel incorporation protein HypA 2 [Sphaerisporangium krabiense]